MSDPSPLPSKRFVSTEWLAARLPVPLVNPGPLTYKLVEALLALGLTHSRACYPKPQVPKLTMLHAMLDAAARAERK